MGQFRCKTKKNIDSIDPL